MLGLLEQSGSEKLKIGASSIIVREERSLWDMRIRNYVDT